MITAKLDGGYHHLQSFYSGHQLQEHEYLVPAHVVFRSYVLVQLYGEVDQGTLKSSLVLVNVLGYLVVYADVHIWMKALSQMIEYW